MLRLFFAVFGGAFVILVGGMAMAPSLVLGAYQDELVQAWQDAGVDTASCDGSVPAIGMGVQDCYGGSMRDLAEKLNNTDNSQDDLE
jgi:hypothetical protein